MTNNEFELVEAARDDDLLTVTRLLELGVSIDSRDDKEWTALHTAAYEGRKNIVELLLKKGADVNARTSDKQTPLMCAAYNGSLYIIEILMKHGAVVNDKDAHGWTPLMFVTIYRNEKTHYVELAKRLLNKGADASAMNEAGWNAAMMAHKNGMPELEQLILGKMSTTKTLNESLHEYIENIGSSLPQDAKEKIEAILKNGGNINKKDRITGATALDIAARNNNAGIVSLLLDHGADPNITNGIGRTPLINAATWGKTDALKALLAHGTSVNSIERWGGSALDAARDDNNFENVKLLIEAGADVNAQDCDGNTPLMKAVLNKQVNIEKLLLQNGADPNIRNKHGHTLEDMRHMSNKWV